MKRNTDLVFWIAAIICIILSILIATSTPPNKRVNQTQTQVEAFAGQKVN